MTKISKHIAPLMAGAALAAILTVGATAKPGHDRMAGLDLDQDQQISQSEFVTAADARFTESDANADGFVTEDERDAYRKAKREEMRKNRFAKVDTNGDGAIDAVEFSVAQDARSEQMFDRLDRDDNGVIAMGEGGERDKMSKRKGKKRGDGQRRGQRSDRVSPDTDGDGQVSFAEHQVHTLAMFEQMDANADGFLSKEDRALKREARKDRR